MTTLTGIWQSTDKRETRHIYITRVSAQYAYGFRCDHRGWRLGKETAGEVRVLLNGRCDGLARYRRPATPEPDGGQRDDGQEDAK